MKILIIEDERYTADYITRLVRQYDSSIEIIKHLSTVEESVKWFLNRKDPVDLILMDVQLSDGSSFDIIEKVNIKFPIIFITAFNEYAINAFRFNSIDYLLKPIDYADLEKAFDKFFQLVDVIRDYDSQWYKGVFSSVNKPYKKRFLIKIGEQFKFLQTENIAYFEVEESIVSAQLFNGERQIINESLDELVSVLDPETFYRLNRKIMASIHAISQIHTYFNRRLSVRLLPGNLQAVVSRERVSGFKTWMNG